MSFCRQCGHELANHHAFCPGCGAPTSGSGSPPPTAVPLSVRYRLEGLLGEGATGAVYRALSIATGTAVAVKRVRAAGARAHLAAEVAVLQQLTHPNVVRLLDHGEDDQGPWLVTELVEGASLRQLLAHTGALAPEQALGVLAGALSGLAAIHASGLVHGDVKPENILVDASSGTSKLTDVGVPGAGSPGYQAPEVLGGTRPDVRSDLYAVGVVLYEALAGHPPFAADRPETLAHLHAHEPVPAVPDVPADLDALVRRCLAKDPAARPESAHALLGDLEHVARTDYGADWRVRGSVSALSAAIGAEGALVGLTEAAGAPASAGPLQAAGGAQAPPIAHPTSAPAPAPPSPPASAPAQPAPAQPASTGLFRVSRLLRYAAVHKAASVAVSVAAVVAVAGGGYAVARVVAHGGTADASSPAAAASGPATSTSTSTSTSTTTTTVPVATPTSLPVVVCPTSITSTQPSAATQFPATLSATVTPTEARALEFYIDQAAVFSVLAPRGWSCVAGIGPTGEDLLVTPPGVTLPFEDASGPAGSGTSTAGKEPVTPGEQVISVNSESDFYAFALACSLFPVANQQLIQDQVPACPGLTSPPAGEGTTILGPHAVEYTDPMGLLGNGNPSGGSYAATGVITFNPFPSGEEPFNQLTCTVAPPIQALCQPIVTDFATRFANG